MVRTDGERARSRHQVAVCISGSIGSSAVSITEPPHNGVAFVDCLRDHLVSLNAKPLRHPVAHLANHRAPAAEQVAAYRQIDQFGPALLEINTVNGGSPDKAKDRPRFEDLTALFPDEKLRLVEKVIQGRDFTITTITPPKAQTAEEAAASAAASRSSSCDSFAWVAAVSGAPASSSAILALSAAASVFAADCPSFVRA
jgi:hypothetical protein